MSNLNSRTDLERRINLLRDEIARADAAATDAWQAVRSTLRLVFDRITRADGACVDISQRRHPWDRRDQEAIARWRSSACRPERMARLLRQLARLRRQLDRIGSE